MKIAIFSDIHANYQALEAIISDIKESNFDKVYFLGDALSKGPNPRECLELIMENNIEMVLGNHELYFLRGVEIDNLISDIEKEHQAWIRSQLTDKHRDYLLKCDLEKYLEVDGLKFSFRHFLMKDINKGYPFYLIDVLNTNNINDIIESHEEDIMFIGHEHRIFEIHHENKKLIDVGSSGCLDNDKTYYMVLNIKDGKYTLEKEELSYDREKFEKVFFESNYPEKDFIAGIFFGL